MADSSPNEPEPPPTGHWYQFGLGKLFLITTLVAMLAAGWAALTQTAGSGAWSFSQLVAIVLLVLAGPLVALISASLFRFVLQWIQRRGQ